MAGGFLAKLLFTVLVIVIVWRAKRIWDETQRRLAQAEVGAQAPGAHAGTDGPGPVQALRHLRAPRDGLHQPRALPLRGGAGAIGRCRVDRGRGRPIGCAAT